MAPEYDGTQYLDRMYHLTQVVDLLLAQSLKIVVRLAALEADRIELLHAETERIHAEEELYVARCLVETEAARGRAVAIDRDILRPFAGRSHVHTPDTALGDHTIDEEETLSVKNSFADRVDHRHRAANPFAAGCRISRHLQVGIRFSPRHP